MPRPSLSSNPTYQVAATASPTITTVVRDHISQPICAAEGPARTSAPPAPQTALKSPSADTVWYPKTLVPRAKAAPLLSPASALARVISLAGAAFGRSRAPVTATGDTGTIKQGNACTLRPAGQVLSPPPPPALPASNGLQLRTLAPAVVVAPVAAAAQVG